MSPDGKSITMIEDGIECKLSVNPGSWSIDLPGDGDVFMDTPPVDEVESEILKPTKSWSPL